MIYGNSNAKCITAVYNTVCVGRGYHFDVTKTSPINSSTLVIEPPVATKSSRTANCRRNWYTINLWFLISMACNGNSVQLIDGASGTLRFLCHGASILNYIQSFHNVYLATRLYNTGVFTSIHQAPALIEDAVKQVDDMECLQRAYRAKITGQGQYGSLNLVCRSATKLSIKGWQSLTDHSMAASLHTAALTENVCETFFSLVTLCLGGVVQWCLQHNLNGGKAVSRAELRWRKGQQGYFNQFAIAARAKHHYSRHTHVLPQWTGLSVVAIHPAQQPKIRRSESYNA